MKRISALLASFAIIAGLTGCFSAQKQIEQTADGLLSDFTTDDTAFAFEGEVGAVTIKPSTDGKVHTDVSYTARGFSSSVLEEILNETELKSSSDNGVFRLSFVKKGTDTSIWKAVKDEHANYNIDVKAEIAVPETMTGFTISTNVGSVTVEDISGTMDLTSNVGNIMVSGAALQGDSKFITNVGNVQLSLVEALPENSQTEFSSDTGSIEVQLSGKPEKGSAVSIKTDVGNVTFDTAGGEFTENIEKGTTGGSGSIAFGDGCTAQVSTYTGKINVK